MKASGQARGREYGFERIYGCEEATLIVKYRSLYDMENSEGVLFADIRLFTKKEQSGIWVLKEHSRVWRLVQYVSCIPQLRIRIWKLVGRI